MSLTYLPVRHCQNTTNGSRVITEKDTTKGDEHANANGGPCRTLFAGGLVYEDTHLVGWL